ncbi:hypothetical protein FRX31_011486 [Thalictrum thalictroides]|uniref:Uncharacterized protein n=1 Tax=Thalictrum thalictroides TaxID=46969 RepID=A0A7J6WR37_THATH|nr:hypothetical protein FRX31_011486 [Thalictrum thalictroides]
MSPITVMKKKLLSPLKKLTASSTKKQDVVTVPKGFLLVYVGEERYQIPLQYTSSPLFLTLFKSSEKEYTFEFDEEEEVQGPIILPCTMEMFQQFLEHV